MRIEQRHWTSDHGWRAVRRAASMPPPQLVFVFGATDALAVPDRLAELAQMYPSAQLVGCSTAGEICGTQVFDGSIVATAVHLEHTSVRTARVCLREAGDSAEAGRKLAATLDHERLVHVFVLSDGLKVNGSALVSGLTRALPAHVGVTGGLSGDAARFERTVVIDETMHEGAVVIVGFYGDRLRVGHGSLGGWDTFGPDRLITRAAGNVLYQLDNEPALQLYKTYLGPHAAELPASGLLFPLSVRTADQPQDAGVVRTILSVDEAEGSITFAGDMPAGGFARLMKANFDRLIDGASGAASATRLGIGGSVPELAILISCVGRKLVLGQRTEEEVESVRDVLSAEPALTGFYSYGEISPFTPSARCELHNQTMTITTFAEC